MKYYAVASINFKNNEWVADYLQKVTPMVERVRGKYLARTRSLELVEGNGPAPETLLIIEFPSKESAETFYHSDEYQPFKQARQNGSEGDFFLVAGQDIGKMWLISTVQNPKKFSKLTMNDYYPHSS